METLAATDFDRGIPEVKETVIRRIGGNDERTESIEAVVSFDAEGGGMLTDGHGKLVEFTGTMEIPADQETTLHDEWVIQERVYRQVGEATGRDGGSQTIHFVRRKGQTSTAPRLRQ